MMNFFVSHLWQSTLFAVAAVFFTVFFRKSHARIRYWLWFAASIKFLIPFSLFIALGSSIDFIWPRLASTPLTAFQYVEDLSQPFGLTSASAEIPAIAISDRIKGIPILLAGIWICGFMAVLLYYMMKGRRLIAAVRQAKPIEGGRVNEILQALELSIGFKRRIKLASSSSSLEPGVFGMFRPILIIPDGIVERLEDSELEAIVAHEVVHVYHHDNILAAAHMLVEALFWFHPLVWWLGARLVHERERACDEEVLKLGKDPRSYAEGILKVCEFYLESPLACAAGVTGADMNKRIQAIVKRSIGRKLSYFQKFCLATAFIAALAVPVLVGLLNVPVSQAQSQTGSNMSFEMVSIKPAPNCDGSRPADLAAGSMDLPCVRLQSLIRRAHSDLIIGGERNPRPIDVVGGPQWIDTDTFHLQAKTEAKATTEEMYGPMLRALLEEKFKLKVHREFRDNPVYELTVVKKNPNLQPTKEGSCVERDANDFSYLSKPEDMIKYCGVGIGAESNLAVLNPNVPVQSVDWQGLSMAGFAKIITSNVDRPVIDKTGLTGLFDFHLEFVLNHSRFSGQVLLNGSVRPDFPEPSVDITEPSIYTAVEEQLGLKLSPAKGKVEVFVIDNVEKPYLD